MDWKHLLWIIPLTILFTALFVHPNLWNGTDNSWNPIGNLSDVCYNKVEHTMGIDLYNCNSGKVYNDQASVHINNYTTRESWSRRFYCE